MLLWDEFNTSIVLHFVARKNFSDSLGTNRWLDGNGRDTYRRVLKEDVGIQKYWAECCDRHQGIVRDYAIVDERMKSEKERPRKKAH